MTTAAILPVKIDAIGHRNLRFKDYPGIRTEVSFHEWQIIIDIRNPFNGRAKDIFRGLSKP